MEALNELLFLDLKDMHFSFPFTAGQYPQARYGHACCKYVHRDQEHIFMVGGMTKVFCTMDIYTLTQTVRKEGQAWEKIVQKSPLEDLVSKRAASVIYQARKYKVELYDMIIEEKTAG